MGRFVVQGVPTAEASLSRPGTRRTLNALFREVWCLLLVGNQESAANYRPPMIAAVHAIWKRTDTQERRVRGLIAVTGPQAAARSV